MDIYEPSQAARFAQLLSAREQELRGMLRAMDHLPGDPDGAGHDVLDFKDVAVEQTLARLDRANAHRIEAELAQVVAAQRRLAEHGYGKCLDCGDPIDLRRLLALPATPFCAACQSTHESGRAPRHQAL